MLMKICQRCGRKLKQGESCKCGPARHREYNEYRRDKSKNEFYHSREWAKLVEKVRSRANGLDEYAMSEGRLELGNTVHHIFTLDERPDLKCSIENLIYVSAENHNRIHAEYRKSERNKYKMQNELKAVISGKRA